MKKQFIPPIKAHGFPDLFDQINAVARTGIPRSIVFDGCETKEDAQARIIHDAVEATDAEMDAANAEKYAKQRYDL